MPFDFSWTLLIITGVVIAWLLCSQKVYHIIADFPPEDRDWSDRTLPRRIAWVVAGPLTFVFIVGVGVGAILLDVCEQVWEWVTDDRRLSAYRKRARTRRARFLSKTPA